MRTDITCSQHRGISFLVASLVTLVLIAIMFWVFTPGTPLASLRLGGLVAALLLGLIFLMTTKPERR